MDKKAAYNFLLEASRYFHIKAMRTKEDSEYWASLQNSKNMILIAEMYLCDKEE